MPVPTIASKPRPDSFDQVLCGYAPGTNFDDPCSVIAATSRDLEQAIAEKKFREDLYYRLSVIVIHVPRCGSVARTFRCLRNIFCTAMPANLA
jgi:hypothetical protein